MSIVSRRLLLGVLLGALVALTATSLAAAAVPAPGNAGAVRFVKVTSSSFDRWTDSPNAQVSTTPAGSSTTFASWMNAKFWRSAVFAGYFDNKNSWYDKGWMYIDSYAIYAGTQAASQQADWILRDGQGNKLFIPWGCANGTCPQYAADIGNPDYRAWFVAYVKGLVAKGYRGVWLDDVNFDFRVGDGSGRIVAPMDPRTGRTMTEDAWRDSFATLVEQLRAALPNTEMVHNSIWYAGGDQRDANAAVQREIKSADVINLERGVNDDGLTGGTGQWSLNAYFAFVDRLHAAGKSVVFDSYDPDPQARAYNLGAYFLVSQGSDGVGLSSMTPANWWSMYDVDLGAACGPRQSLGDGLLRRDFTNGTVIVGDPSATGRTVGLDHAMLDENGATVTTVKVGARSAAILRGTTNCTPDATIAPPRGADAVSSPAPAASTPAGTAAPSSTTPSPTTPSTTPKPATTPTSATTKPVAKRPRLKITRISTHRSKAKARSARIVARAAAAGRRDVLVTGRATGLRSTKLGAAVYRRVAGRWVRDVSASVAVGRAGGWALLVTGAARGSYRIVVKHGTLAATRRFTVVG